MFGWLRERGAWLVVHPAALGLVVASAFGGGAAGVPAANGLYDYMWRDPRFCGDCHVHDYANKAWSESVHARLTTCHDCHRVPLRHYPVNLWDAIFARPHTPEDIPIAEVHVVLCEQCHARGNTEPLTGPMPESLRSQVPKIDASPLHRVHLDADHREPTPYHGGKPGGEPPKRADVVDKQAIVCVDCHSGPHEQVHKFTATSERCETCHAGMHPKDESGRAMSCLDCHVRGFLGETPTATSAPLPGGGP